MTEVGAGGGGIRKFLNNTLGGLQDKLQSGSSTSYGGGGGGALLCGWLRRHGGVMRSWQRRWFRLENHQLSYYSGQDEAKCQGAIPLLGNNVTEIAMNPAKPEEFLFEIIPGKWAKILNAGEGVRIAQGAETCLLCAATDEERKAWVGALKRVMYSRKGGAIFGAPLFETLQHEVRLRGARNIPELVEMCSDFIREHGLTTEGIFRLPGRASLIRELKERFDTGQRPPLELGAHDVATVASLLKQYLRDLPQPLVPFTHYEAVMRIVNREFPLSYERGLSLLGEVMLELPRDSYNLLQYLCQLLSQIASHQDVNKMTAMNLATVFMHCVIRPEDDDPALLMGTTQSRSQCAFLLLVKHEELFPLHYPVGEATPVAQLIDADSQHGTEGEAEGEARGVYGVGEDSVGEFEEAVEAGEEGGERGAGPSVDELLLGFNPNHYSPPSALPAPLQPRALPDTACPLNRKGSRKGRIFEHLSFGAAGSDAEEEEEDEAFACADYVDSDTAEAVRRGVEPGLGSSVPLQSQCAGGGESGEGDYSLLSNYSSVPPRPGNQLAAPSPQHALLRMKPPTDPPHSSPPRLGARPQFSPPRPPAPVPRPRRSLPKSRSKDEEALSPERPPHSGVNGLQADSGVTHLQDRVSTLLATDLSSIEDRQGLLEHISQLHALISDQSTELMHQLQKLNNDRTCYEQNMARERARFERDLSEKDAALREEREATSDAVNKVMELQQRLGLYNSRYGSITE